VLWSPPEEFPTPIDNGQILQQHYHEHPIVQEHLRTGDGSPHAISDFLTEREFSALHLYRLVFEPLGLRDQLAFALPAPRPLLIGIALNRRRRGFSERDRLLAQLLRPYLMQAHRSVQLAAQVTASEALGLEDRVGLLLRPGGRVAPLHGEIPDWLRGSGLLAGGRLDEETRAWIGREARFADVDALPALSSALVRTGPHGRFACRAVRTKAGTVLVVTRSESEGTSSRNRLRSLGLTPREAEVLQHLTRGRSNREIAGKLDVSLSTVKRHLESVYRKLGVTNRTEAAAFAADTMVHG
jgi:DNA-binding CsgD family transcriptional regulator